MDLAKGIKSIEQFSLEGRRVLIRADFAVPLTPEGTIQDDSRIHAALPTIKYAMEQGAKVVLAAHLGKPKGKRVNDLSMLIVGERLQELLTRSLGREVEIFVPDECVGDGPRKLIMERLDGEVVLLENLQFHPEEEANDGLFAQRLAALGDVYVNDAFAACHHAYASLSGVPRLFVEKGAGLALMKELSVLSRLLSGQVDAPFVVAVGGERFADKVGFMTNLLGRGRTVLVGGGTAVTLLAAQGLGVGRSKVDSERIEAARNFLSRARLRQAEVLLPVDLVVAREVSDEATSETVPSDSVPEDALILDIGPKTALMFATALGQARTVFWNGPMGVFERPRFRSGTEAVAKAIARSSGLSVVGGVDTVAAVARLVLTPFFRHVSLGGPATLMALEGRELPGITALRETA